MAVPLLVRLLNDPEEKTRANAAGALGNLVRNGSTLCGTLVRHGVPQALLSMAAGDPSLSARRIALFSIGNLAVYTACRQVLLGPTRPLEAVVKSIMATGDARTRKYVPTGAGAIVFSFCILAVVACVRVCACVRACVRACVCGIVSCLVAHICLRHM